MKHQAIPTNLITGFLGVGKTSVILQLLTQRPRDERFAVLVNEFGAVGIDGSYIRGQQNPTDGVAIVEVPGGCMCCVTGPLTQVALNKLIRSARPQRLLIEPSGLGHPFEVLELLNSEYYRDVLSVQKTVTLVDARNLSDPRYTEHPTFNQQIAIADVVVGNKEDLYGANDKQVLIDYVQRHAHPNTEVLFANHGNVALELLDGTTDVAVAGREYGDPAFDESNLQSKTIPECGYVCEVNRGEGFESIGWRFDPSWMFSRQKVLRFLHELVADRAKAVIISDEGIFAYNRDTENLLEVELDDCLESRVEIIAAQGDPDWQLKLFECRVSE